MSQQKDMTVEQSPEVHQKEAKTSANGGDHHDQGMITLAEKVEQHHRQPIPEATEPAPRPFPPMLWQGLLVSMVIGALVGWLWGWLLLSGTLVIPGWEGLYSMVPTTFYAFWIFAGIALGILLGGVGTILLAKPEAH